MYARLSGAGVTVNELAAATGKMRNTVTAAVHVLRKYELADVAGVQGRAWLWVRGSADVADVAVKLDCEGAATRRRERIVQERARLQAWFDGEDVS